MVGELGLKSEQPPPPKSTEIATFVEGLNFTETTGTIFFLIQPYNDRFSLIVQGTQFPVLFTNLKETMKCLGQVMLNR